MNPATKYFDEAALLQSFRENDLMAVREIYNIYYHQLLNYASRYVKETDQVEDIISESFVIVWQKRHEFESLKSVAAYLYTVTRNACFGYLKANKRKNLKHLEYGQIFSGLNGLDETEAIRADLIQFTIIAAGQLPAKMKEVFRLTYLEGFSIAEAADRLQLSVSTIKNQKHVAITRVRKTLIEKGLLILFL